MCMSPSTDTTSRLGRDMGVTYLSVTYLGERNPNYLEQVAAPLTSCTQLTSAHRDLWYFGINQLKEEIHLLGVNSLCVHLHDRDIF